MVINIRKSIKSVFLVISVGFLFFSNLVTINVYDLNIKIQKKWVIIFIFSIIISFFILIINYSSNIYSKKSRNRTIFLLLWELFVLVTFISKIIHKEFDFFEFMLFSLLIPISFFNNKIKEYRDMILIASIISVIPLIRILGPMNSLGTIISIAGINLIILLSSYKVKDIYIYISILISAVCIYITESRTSLIAFLFIAVLVIFKTLKQNNREISKWIKNGIKILGILIVIYFSFDNIYDLIFSKYDISNLDILSGRRRIWTGTFQTGISLFGNGNNYFLYNYGIGDAHNIFIQILGEYGLLSFIFFIIIYLYIIIKSLNYIEKIEYIWFFSGFLLLGLAENLFFINSRMIYSNIIFLLYLGCIINED